MSLDYGFIWEMRVRSALPPKADIREEAAKRLLWEALTFVVSLVGHGLDIDVEAVLFCNETRRQLIRQIERRLSDLVVYRLPQEKRANEHVHYGYGILTRIAQMTV